MMPPSFSSLVPAPTSALLPPSVAGILFWIAVVACIVSQYFIIRAVWRAVPSETGSPNVPSPHRAMEIGWAILPAVLLVAVFLGAWQALHQDLPSTSLPAAAAESLSASTVRS